MGKTYIKTIIREVKQSFGRFFAIFSIVALGVGFLAGLLATTPSMYQSVEEYYETHNMTDIFIKAPLGLTQEDLEEVSNIKEVDHVMPAYVTDAVMESEGSDVYTARIYGVPLKDLNGKDSEFINRLELIEGRMPRSNSECVIERPGEYISEIEIGTSLSITEANDDEKDRNADTYNNTEYTVVGIVSNPFYFSLEREPSGEGDGRLGAILYVNEESYNLDVYTDFYIRVLGSSNIPSFTDEYDAHIKVAVDQIKEVGKIRSRLRYTEVIQDASELLGDAKDNYDLAKIEAYQELDAAKIDLDQGQAEIAKAEEELSSARIKLSESKNKLDQEKRDYKSKISAQESEFEQAQQAINSARQDLINGQTFIGMDEFNRGMSNILDQESQLIARKSQLNAQKKEAESEFAQGEAQIAKAQLEVDKGQAELRLAKEDLLKGQVEYDQAKKQVEEELEDADLDIIKAEEDIEDIKYEKWYVLDRDSNVSYASFSANAEKVGAIAKVFPIFFLLVAALVALTTMTRMVEEERTQIGTLKALGYTKGVIMSKYIIYCGLATLLGSVSGLLAGLQILPNVIWLTYESMYSLPGLNVEFSWTFAIISTLAAIASTMIATISAASKALREKPSTLMLPRAPKAGKRILLERLTFIWSRMKFTYKATARNLVRYKKHFFMTVIGISGCTALIVAGFGIRDSIGDIANTQFDEIFKYNLIVETDDTGKDDKVLEDFINDPDKSKDYMKVFSEDGKALLDDESFNVSIRVPEEAVELKKFIDLRNRPNSKPITFNHESVVVVEKLADAMDLKIGDRFDLENSDDQLASFVVTGITENYVGTYIYINQKAYIKAFGDDLSYDTLMIKTPITGSSDQDIALEEVLGGDTVLSAEFMSQTKESYDKLLESINYIVIVLILAAGGLAVIVLYNLTNINIDERRKELATLKVLGFHNKEVAAYIYRETTILSLIGTGVGLFLGKLLHTFVIIQGESVDLMFGRTISVWSFVISAIITMLFSFIVDGIMYKKLKNIEMVDSMKAID